MALLGNLLTDVYDSFARESLAMFTASGGLGALQNKLDAEYPTNLYACATLQNMTSLDPFDCCTQLREAGLPVSGLKAELIARLEGSPPIDAAAAAPLPPPAVTVASDMASILVEIEHCKS